MAEYGTYADLAILKAEMLATDTDDDAVMLRKLEDASRQVDDHCGRHFYVVTATRYYSPEGAAEFICPDDILGITSLLGDEDDDRTWGDIWTASDYELYPFNRYPKWKILRRSDGDYSFLPGASRLKIVGRFGYGDGFSASPYKASGATVTVATTAGTTVTASSGGAFAVGNTILAGTEQMYVQAISGNNLTAVRGANGTTAAIQAAAAASIAVYPDQVRDATLLQAMKLYRRKETPGGVISSGEFGVRIYADLDMDQKRMLSRFRKVGLA